jgi:ArsR family transcriptional regulator
MHEQLNSGQILDILGNDTRRKILATLAQEPMYFNQLAKEIRIGQQAILRHLQILVDSGIVETYSGKSDLGAPDRKYYRLNNSFILTISISADDFAIRNQKKKEMLMVKESRHKESKRHRRTFSSLNAEVQAGEGYTGQILSSLQDDIAGIENEISKLEGQLNDLYALKQLVLHKLHEIGQDVFEEEERKVLYRIVEESPKSVAELAVITNKKESSLRAMMSSMKEKIDEHNAKTLFDLS